MRAKAGVLLKGPIGVQKLQPENCNFDGNDRPLFLQLKIPVQKIA